MRLWLLILVASFPYQAFATVEDTLPVEVHEYIEEREICEHFRGEPHEGDSERRKFIADSLDIYCSGTDRRLKALKRRYRNNERVITALSIYELCVELNCGELTSQRK